MIDDLHHLPPSREVPANLLQRQRAWLVRELETVDGSVRRIPAPGARRFAAIAVSVAALAVIVSPAFGVASRIADLFHGSPNAPAVDAGQAQRLASVQVTGDEQASLWQVPTTAGGLCLFVQVAAVTPSSATANGGALCDRGAEPTQLPPVQTIVNWIPAQAGFSVVVFGRVRAGIAKMQLSEGSDVIPLRFTGRYFVGALPGAVATAGSLPSGDSFVISGYDASGRQVAHVDLQQLIAASTP